MAVRETRSGHFRPYKVILDMLVHELVHNTHLEHAPAFHALMKQYQEVGAAALCSAVLCRAMLRSAEAVCAACVLSACSMSAIVYPCAQRPAV